MRNELVAIFLVLILSTGIFQTATASMHAINPTRISILRPPQAETSEAGSFGSVHSLSDDMKTRALVSTYSSSNKFTDMVAASSTLYVGDPTIDVSPAVRITSTGNSIGDGYYERDSQLLTASGGTWYLTYSKSQTTFTHDGDPDALKYDIYVKTSSDGGATWSAETKVLDAAGISSSSSFRSSTICEADGKIWDIGADIKDLKGDIYANTYSSGTWSGQTKIFNGTYSTSAFHLDSIVEGNDIRLFYGIQEESEGVGFIKYHSSTHTWDATVTKIGPSAGYQIPRVIKVGSTYYMVSTNWDHILFTKTTTPDIVPWPSATYIFDAPSGGSANDPTILKYGNSGGTDDLIVFSAPSYSDGSQRIEYVYSTDAGGTWTSPLPFTEAAHGSQISWDMMPRAYLKDSSTIMLLYSMEQRGVNRGQGDIVVSDWSISSTIGNKHYTTIQDGINAANPGDIIWVYPGTYNEAININRAVKVLGSGASTTVIDGTGLVLASAGLVKITAAGDVTFSGFTVRNAPPGGGVTIEILSQSSVAGVTYTVSYNNIYGTNDPSNDQDFGFYSQGDSANVVFTHNLVTQTGCNNIVFELHTGSTEISCNTLDAGVWGTDAVFIMTYEGKDVTALQNVSYNTFDMSTGGPFDYDHRASAISFNTWPIAPDAKFTNVVIQGNTINNLKSYRRGIGFWNGGGGGGAIAPLVKSNTITGVIGSTGSYGIDFVGVNAAQNATVMYNKISNADWGIYLRTAGCAPGAKIHYNDIAGNNRGLDNAVGPSEADARFNWWGDSSGPLHSVTNAGGLGNNVTDNTDYSPWLGFVVRTSPMTLHVNPTGTIQEAIDEASSGDTIIVHSGTYRETLVINKSIILKSASKPVIEAPDTRKTYTIPENSAIFDPIIIAYGGSESGGTISGSVTISVTIDGFEINGRNTAGSARFVGILYRNVKPGTISNINIHNMYPPDGQGHGPQTFGILVYGDSNVTVEDNEVRDFSRGGIGVTGDLGALPKPVATVTQNTVVGNGLEPYTDWWAENGIQMSYGAGGSITENSVTNCKVNNPYWVSTGILVVNAAQGVNILQNIVINCDTGITVTANASPSLDIVDGNNVSGCTWDAIRLGLDGPVDHVAVSNNIVSKSMFGIGVWDTSGNTISHNTIKENDYGIDIDGNSNNNQVFHNDILDNTADGIVVEPYDGFEPSGTMIHYDNITGNAAYGVEATGINMVDARFNWWGDASGPTHSSNIGGTGDGINDNVDYSPWLGFVVGTSPMTWHINPTGGSDAFQEAIDEASDGDTIVAHAGTYYENQTIIYKSLTVMSNSGADTTIIDGSNATLSVGGLIRITATAGDAVFSGFSLRNAGNTLGGDRFGIYASSSVPGHTYTISYNKIYGTNNPDDAGDYGIYAAWGKEKLVFTYNFMTQHGSNPILIEVHTGETDVSYNDLDEGAYGSTVYFSMTHDGTNITTLQKVSHNIINLGTGEHAGSDYYGGGIVFRSAYAGLYGNGTYTNVQISDNVIYNLKGYRRAIELSDDALGDGSGGQIISPTIYGNVISGAGETESIGIRLRGLVTGAIILNNQINDVDKGIICAKGINGNHSPQAIITYNNITQCNIGINITDSATATVEYNDIRNNSEGIFIGTNNNVIEHNRIVGNLGQFSGIHLTSTADGNEIHYNCIVGNTGTNVYGIYKEGGSTANATYNWWGDSTGPYHPTKNPSGLGNQVSDYVLFDPWLKAYFEYSPMNPMISQPVTFNATLSTKPCNSRTIVSYTWDFADGNVTTITDPTVVHAFVAAGNYNVTLTLTYDDATTGTEWAVVHIAKEPYFKVNPESVQLGLINKTCQIDITINDLDPSLAAVSYEFRLLYNATLLQVVNMTEGPFLKQFNQTSSPPYTLFSASIENSPPYGPNVHVRVVILPNATGGYPGPFPQGNGTIATITFKAIYQEKGYDAIRGGYFKPAFTCNFTLNETLIADTAEHQIPHRAEQGRYTILPDNVGDVNWDGKVRIDDILMAATAFGSDPSKPNWNPNADINHDNKVRVDDIFNIALNFGWTATDC